VQHLPGGLQQVLIFVEVKAEADAWLVDLQHAQGVETDCCFVGNWLGFHAVNQ
jgi:hypothetical protein